MARIVEPADRVADTVFVVDCDALAEAVVLTDNDAEEQKDDAGVDKAERDVVDDGLRVRVPATVTDAVIFATDEVAVGARAVADETLDGADDLVVVVDEDSVRVAADVRVAVAVADDDFVLLAVAVALDVDFEDRVADDVAVTVLMAVVVELELEVRVADAVADELRVAGDAEEDRLGISLAVFAADADSLREGSALLDAAVECEEERVAAGDRVVVAVADAVVVFEKAADDDGVGLDDLVRAALRDAAFVASALRVCAAERVAVVVPVMVDVTRADRDASPDARTDWDMRGDRVRLRVDV